MWNYSTDFNKWLPYKDELTLDNYNFYKQELQSVRFYSKCLSGATFLPVSDTENIYDILGEYKPMNWYIGINGSPYTNTLIPSQNAREINKDTSYEFYTKYLSEYGLTLKNHFTPRRIIKDSSKNFIEVDVATTNSIDLTQAQTVIDGITLVTGHRVLVKNQTKSITLLNTDNPDDFIMGYYRITEDLGATIGYTYYDDTNGIYEFDGTLLNKLTDLDDYENCVRLSILVKEGGNNKDKQFHLRRLKNGYFPTSLNREPFEFVERKNWLLRNRVDYNNLFEINYYDIVKYSTQSYYLNGITYSIPERTISIGEFGVIVNNQDGISNIIFNKYKVNLRSITQTEKYYWIVGDEGILLRVRKHDFLIERIEVDCQCPRNLVTTDLYSISFFNDLKGVAVGELNTILVTKNGGTSWQRIRISDFDSFTFTQCLYYSLNSFFVAGYNGIFIEFNEGLSGWNAIRKRISRSIDDEDEYVLVDNINQIYRTSINTWGLSYSYSTQSIPSSKDILFIVTDDSKIITYEINGNIPNYSFLYLDFPNNYGDIKTISRKKDTNYFYFTGKDPVTEQESIYSFDINNHSHIGIDNSYSNVVLGVEPTDEIDKISPNKIFDFDGKELFVCGNNSLLLSSTYSELSPIDENFESKLKSKMLFLDYDIGAKLSFFTDFGEYRLPNSVYFDIQSTTGAYLELEHIVKGATSPSFLTQSEVNWFDYWKDSSKTFEFYSLNPMSESSKVLTSSKFVYSDVSAIQTVTTISTESEHILPLAPKILDDNSSRFNGFGLTAISAPKVFKDLYVYDYLMVTRLPLDFPVESGDILRFDSSIITSNLVVNKVITLTPKNSLGVPITSQSRKYAYMFTDFNGTINNQLTGLTNSITLTNLNKYKTFDELNERFNYHPLSIGYKMDISSIRMKNSLHMDFSYGSATNSYTNWIFNGNFATSSNFTDDGYPYSVITNDIGDYYIETPEIQNVSNIYLSYVSNKGNYSPSGTYSYINTQGLSGSNWYDIKNIIISNGFSGDNVNSVTFSTNYNFSKYRFNLRCSSAISMGKNSIKSIRIDDIKLFSDPSIDLSVDPSSYGTYSVSSAKATISPKFNNYTAYYNMSGLIKTNMATFSMVYTDGFLNFGYTPTYNLLDYLENLNDKNSLNPIFYGDKEIYSMPHYNAIPLQGVGNFTTNILYIEYNGITQSSITGNSIFFGSGRKLEWDSLLVGIFVDVILYGSDAWGDSPNYTTERLLITEKYYVKEGDYYVIKFHKNLNFTLYQPLYFIDIKARRKLSQISEDLQELNNIQRPKLRKRELEFGNPPSKKTGIFDSYEREINSKFYTDSYAKFLLSDSDFIKNLTAIIYTDYKNELSLNVTNLGKDLNISILNTTNFEDKLFITCGQKHELKTGDGVVLEFNGGVGSSQELNQQYFGYHTVEVISDYNLIINNVSFGQNVIVGIDSGFIKYSKKDPFFNYQPVDIIDLGIDKKGKQSVELKVENVITRNNKYTLINVDYSKYRFRLIDQLNIESLSEKYPWILEAEISDAIIGEDTNGLIWYKGTWECGRWFGGTWISGAWVSGDWYGGTWRSLTINDKKISVEIDEKSSSYVNSTWFGGRWYTGNWEHGLWIDGRWYGGTWNNGIWYKGIWNEGTWLNGNFTGGVWINGTWENGIFNCDNNPAYWLDGKWFGGDFENGMWYNGLFDERDLTDSRLITPKKSRFGTKSYNSRTATWHGGKWSKGNFYSKVNINDDGKEDVSDTHKYSIWYTGQWISGNWYGGIAYNMDFKSGNWYGGILEDIQIIGLNSTSNYFVLNGIFKFNIGDKITILDRRSPNELSSKYGNNSSPKEYTVLYTVEDSVNKWTNVYVASNIVDDIITPTFTGLWIASRFKSVNWKSGIWTNGIYESGNWEGGIWYNGVFEGTWM